MPSPPRPRLKLLLGKFEVTRVERRGPGLTLAIEFPGLGHLIAHVPVDADVRETDLLTIYTEIYSNVK